MSLPERGTEVAPILRVYGTGEYLHLEVLAREYDRPCVSSGKVVLCVSKWYGYTVCLVNNIHDTRLLFQRGSTLAKAVFPNL